VSASKPHPSARRPRARGAAAGFTLLEALIAIVILALSLSALLQVYGTGLRGVARIDDHLRARLLAQSVMAELSHDRRLRPGTVQGRQDQFVWTLSVTRFDNGEPPSQQPGPWTLHRLALTVSWSQGRRIELQTLRMLQSR
jgi:general secretion pathway protein I